MVSDKRLETMRRAINHRQLDLTLVIENIHDPHNVGAIFRSADAVGIDEIHLLYTKEKFPALHPKVTGSGSKWVKQKQYSDPEILAEQLKTKGFQLYTTNLTIGAVSFHDIDWTKPSAIIFGNENRGVSSTMTSLADKNIHIPMFGMVESLNVSAAAAVILFEVCRQRIIHNSYPNSELEQEWIAQTTRDWIQKNHTKNQQQ